MMGWVRCHKRYGAWLALAALALQIVLAFGHVHFHGVGGAASQVALAGANNAATGQPARQGPGQNPSGDADDYCAICAAIHLAANSFVPLPPQLPLPAGFERIALGYDGALGVIAPRRTAFQSRAPPAA